MVCKTRIMQTRLLHQKRGFGRFWILYLGGIVDEKTRQINIHSSPKAKASLLSFHKTLHFREELTVASTTITSHYTMSDLNTRFKAAAEKARTIQGVSTSNKGDLYGLFKQASDGPIGDRPRPSMFNLLARQKHDARAKHGDMGKEEAQEKYIALVDSL